LLPFIVSDRPYLVDLNKFTYPSESTYFEGYEQCQNKEMHKKRKCQGRT